MSRLSYAQDRFESEDGFDELALALDSSISDLQVAQRMYARREEITRVLALVQEAVDRLVEVTSEQPA